MKSQRKPISKSLRFEVFKRDKFTCQYCGGKAPDIVLQVDHIHPVAKGGENDILNLITSCFDCNNGKRDRLLSDDSIMDKQRKQLELLEERREQIDLMIEWKKSLANFDDKTIDSVADFINDKMDFHYTVSESYKLNIAKWVKKYNLELLLEAIEISANKYLIMENEYYTKDSANLYLNKIGGIVSNLNLPPIKQKLLHIKNFAKQKFNYWNDKTGSILLNNYVKALSKAGYTDELILLDLEDELFPLTKNAKHWTDWKNSIETWIDNINNWII